jgi:hypothetical protein
MAEMGTGGETMTPTLLGRWQTRIVLLWTIGLALTLGYMQLFGLLDLGPRNPGFWTLPALLGYVTLLGLAWDVLYNYLQSFRWDRDWPLIFQFVVGIVEGIVIFVLFRFNLLPGMTYHAGDGWRFLLHYGTVWSVTYWWLFGPMRVIAPRWRFQGGELI